MDTTQNGGRVAAILKENGSPVDYRIIKGMSHYSVYGKDQQKVLALELDWFDQHLKKTP